jgi:histolysain
VTLDLSEQQVVDCSTTNNGCNGGSTWNAYLYSNGYGINVESSYPYTATKGACQLSTGPYKVQSVRYADGEDAMRSELQYRPYPVYVDSTGEAWQLYSNGVLDICNSSVNHAVLLVGYDVQHNWLIKNSWGTGWGMQGYVTLAAGNTCGIAIYRDYLAWL